MIFLKAKSYNLKARGGFTLIELLIVIAIIGLLSSIVLASLKETKKKAQVATAKELTLDIRTEMENIIDPNGGYPAKFCTCNKNSTSGCSGPYDPNPGKITRAMHEGVDTNPDSPESLRQVMELANKISALNSGWFSTSVFIRPPCVTSDAYLPGGGSGIVDGYTATDAKIKEWATWFEIKSSEIIFCMDSRGMAREMRTPNLPNNYDGIPTCD